MQAIWFTQELSQAQARIAMKGILSQLHPSFDVFAGGKSLKGFTLIANIFQEIYDDQFDFHNYCLRKSTIRDYMKLLKWEDEVVVGGGHRFFVDAAMNALRVFEFLLVHNEMENKFGDVEGLGLGNHKIQPTLNYFIC